MNMFIFETNQFEVKNTVAEGNYFKIFLKYPSKFEMTLAYQDFSNKFCRTSSLLVFVI